MTIALSLAPAAFAQTYIVPDHDCGQATLHVTGTDRVANAYLYLPKQRVEMKPAASSRDFDVVLPVDGVIMAAMNFQPEVRGNETWTEHAKVLIFCSAITPPVDWQRSTDLSLEIFPQWNGPRAKMKAGDAMRFIAVEQKKKSSLLDLPMALYRIGSGHVADGVPARDQGMNFPFPEPGWYMVTATYRRADPDQPQHWLVDTSTLTFEIK